MRYTEEFCNREYNNRALVPEYAQHLERWAEAARHARSVKMGLLDLYYGATSNECIDLFPCNAHDAPLLVYIHGGYWRALEKSDFSWVAPPFVERGINVAVIDYDLAPAVSVRTITLQTLRAIEWLWRGAPRYGYDADRIFVCGHSAGGHLSAMAMSALWPALAPDLPADLIKGAIAVSGLYDLEPIMHASFLNADLKLDAESAFAASPAWMPPATGAPLITAVGELESSEFHRQNRLIGERWRANLRADVPLPQRNHFTAMDALAEPGQALFEATLALCSETRRS
ncbi:MAG: alpha/beta hydrolase [Burkholderiaceae bacterium]|nr:alpha/beta hydrolase [Burkholderiaceae bacterium]